MTTQTDAADAAVDSASLSDTQIKGLADKVEAIGDVNVKIDKIKEISSSVASAIEEQNAAAMEIGRSTQEASVCTQQVSSSIVGVMDASHQTGANASDVLTAAEELSRQSEDLSARVATFVERVRAA